MGPILISTIECPAYLLKIWIMNKEELFGTPSRPYSAVRHDSDEDMLSIQAGQKKHHDLIPDSGESVQVVDEENAEPFRKYQNQ